MEDDPFIFGYPLLIFRGQGQGYVRLKLCHQAVAAGSSHSVLIAEGKVYSMGDGHHGQLGTGGSADESVGIRGRYDDVEI